MNIEDMAIFMATQGYTLGHFYEAMEFHNLDSVNEAIKFLYEQNFCKKLV